MVSSQKFPKSERLNSHKLVLELFSGGRSHAMSAFPLRLVYMKVDDAIPTQVLVSVPKRYLHRANKRNRVKRQIREAYRRNKGLVTSGGVLMAFIWLDSKLYPSDVVSQRVISLLTRMAEKENRQDS